MNEQNNIGQIYKKRAENFRNQALRLKQKYNQLAILRLISFIIGVFLLIYLASIHLLFFLAGILVFLPSFYFFIKGHEQIKSRQKSAENLSVLNELELKAQQHDYSGFPDGHEFTDINHPYSGDLDIFGPFSFFQYINRCTTIQGRQCLASWLQKPASPSQIANRQEAAQELAPLIEWRQYLQVLEKNQKNEEKGIKGVQIWLQEQPILLSNKLLRSVIVVSPLITIVSIVLIGIYMSWNIAWIPLLIPAVIIGRTKDKVDIIHNLTTEASAFLSSLSNLISHLEKASFSNSWLISLQEPFKVNKQYASKEIARLSYLISQLDVRLNFFAIFLNLFGLWDLHWVWQLEKWRARNGQQLPRWFSSFAQLEAANSLSTLHYNHPDWCFPTINDEQDIYFQQVAHPLIAAHKRIGNDLKMPSTSHIKLITGSNMAGKSTFLRTIGLNMVLANAGFPVCAKSCSLPQRQVYSSMRIHDDLHGNTSSFFAELKRLKIIIDAVKAAEDKNKLQFPVFFLLDEILKGTNSRDRHAGSRALILQLIRTNGAGLIATHDLELTTIEKEAMGKVENRCMEVEVENGKLLFDYKIKKGVSQSFNATQLMKQMGIQLDD